LRKGPIPRERAEVMRLPNFGIKHFEMSATPERIWRALREARS
jgi:hypothetical protein